MAAVTIRCPGCEAQLKLGRSKQQLAGKKIKCPKCAVVFVMKAPTSKESLATDSLANSSSKDTQVAKPRRRPDAESGKKQSRVSKATGRPVGHRKKSAAVPPPVEEEPEWMEEYSDDEFYDNADESFDDYGYTPAPKKKRSGKAARSKSKKPQKSGSGSKFASPNYGFGGYAGFGLGAAVLCAVLMTLSGYSGTTWLISGMALVTGGGVGMAVRFAAGRNTGIGPGGVAAALALLSILVGKVGAFSVDPEMSFFMNVLNADGFQSPEERTAEIESYTTEPQMIARIADDVESDESWCSANGVTDEAVDAHWEEYSDDDDEPSARFLPVVWEEATRRWNEISDDQQQQQIADLQREMRRDYGIMNPDEVEQLVTESTSDERTILRIAQYEVLEDEEWMTANGITQEKRELHWRNMPDDPEPEQQVLPAVWTEARLRWEAMSAPDQRQLKDEIATEVRYENTYTEEDAANEKAAVSIIRIIVVAGIALFYPLGGFFCTWLGVFGGFKIGAGSG